jgi:formate dehydrogenase subunit gamma
VSQSGQILPHGRVLRYELHERLTHWAAAFSYIYLLLTGLAFYSPWLFWIAIALGGGQISRMLHPWAGLIFFLAVMKMYSMWAAQMRTTEADKAWWGAVGHYARNEDDKMPPAGRYNAGQKLLFWGFFWCSLLLLLTVLIHPAAALLTIGLFLIHIYMSVFAERGAFGSVIRGDVSVDFAKRYHPGWYKEIVGESSTPRK